MDDNSKTLLINNSSQTNNSYEKEIKIYKQMNKYISKNYCTPIQFPESVIFHKIKNFNNGNKKEKLKKSYSVSQFQKINNTLNELKNTTKEIKLKKRNKIKNIEINNKFTLDTKKFKFTTKLPKLSNLSNLSPSKFIKSENKNKNLFFNNYKFIFNDSIHKFNIKKLFTNLRLNSINCVSPMESLEYNQIKMFKTPKYSNSNINYKMPNFEDYNSLFIDNKINTNTNKKNVLGKIKQIKQIYIGKDLINIKKNNSMTNTLKMNHKENKMINIKGCKF